MPVFVNLHMKADMIRYKKGRYLPGEPRENCHAGVVRIEEDKLVISSHDFCPLIESAKILNIDMTYTYPFSTHPYFHAVLRELNPKVEYKNTKWRAADDTACQEIFWIEG